jgi:hypothetical protein
MTKIIHSSSPLLDPHIHHCAEEIKFQDLLVDDFEPLPIHVVFEAFGSGEIEYIYIKNWNSVSVTPALQTKTGEYGVHERELRGVRAKQRFFEWFDG